MLSNRIWKHWRPGRRAAIALASLLTFAAVGCNGPTPPPRTGNTTPVSTPGDDSTKSPLEETRPADESSPTIASQAKQSLPLTELTFLHESHRELLHKAEAAARRIADPSWAHQPLAARPSSYVLEAVWDSAGSGSPSSKFKVSGQHVIRLNAYRHPNKSKEVLGVAASGTWRPHESGWGAQISYFDDSEQLSYTYKPDSFSLRFHWCPDGRFEYQTRQLEIYEDVARYQTRRQFAGVEYSIDVWTETPPSTRTRVDRATVLRWLASPESLRDEAVESLEALSQRLREQVPSGKAVRRAWLVDGPTSGSPVGRLLSRKPLPTLPALTAQTPRAIPPPKSRRPMTEAEKQQVLDEALAEIENRSAMVRENYRIWFAALNRAFPLRDCLLDQ